MKKIASVLFALSFIGLISCGPSKKEVDEQNKKAEENVERIKEMNEEVEKQQAEIEAEMFAEDVDSTMDADTIVADTVQ